MLKIQSKGTLSLIQYKFHVLLFHVAPLSQLPLSLHKTDTAYKGCWFDLARFLTPTESTPQRALHLDRHAPVVLAGHDFEVRRASPVPSSLPSPLDMPALELHPRPPRAALFESRSVPVTVLNRLLQPRTTSSLCSPLPECNRKGFLLSPDERR